MCSNGVLTHGRSCGILTNANENIQGSVERLEDVFVNHRESSCQNIPFPGTVSSAKDMPVTIDLGANKPFAHRVHRVCIQLRRWHPFSTRGPGQGAEEVHWVGVVVYNSPSRQVPSKGEGVAMCASCSVTRFWSFRGGGVIPCILHCTMAFGWLQGDVIERESEGWSSHETLRLDADLKDDRTRLGP